MSKWIPASRPPDSDRKVIVWCESWRDIEQRDAMPFGYYLSRLKEWRIHGSPSNFNDTVTHWQPLPEPPEASHE